MVKGLAHVCFVVADLEQSIRFYCETLGLKHGFDFRDDKGHRFGVYIKAGARCFIELFEGTNEKAASTSFRHIALEVADIKATVDGLRRNGVTVGETTLGADHSYQAWLSDPDGNQIELHEYTPESWQTPLVS